MAIVTGGSRGLGWATAERLGDSGCRVAVADLSPPVGDQLERLSSRGGVFVKTDATKAADVAATVAHVERELGTVSILVNNAGILKPTRFAQISEGEWDAVLDVTIKGAFLFSKECLPPMLEQGWGRIVNLSSTAGRSVSTIGGAHYTTAKAGILGLTRALAKEVAAQGVTVNAVCPGLFNTEMVLGTIDGATRAEFARSFPIGRLGEPDEVASAIAFLCSDDASYITGAAIDINGGDLML